MKELKSEHQLLTDYSIKARIKSIVIVWIIFGIFVIITRLPILQTKMINFSDNMGVDWVTSSINFIIKGIWIFFIPLFIGTIITIKKKIDISNIRLYNTGIGFINNEGIEEFISYSEMKLSYGSMQQSVFIEIRSKNINLNHDFAWKEFNEPDIFRNNLERFGTWN